MFKMRLLTLCCMLLVTLSFCYANGPSFMPPNPHLPPEILEEMKKKDALRVKDGNYSINPIRDAGKSGMQNSLSNVAMQTLVTGTKKMACILINFPDQGNTNTAADFQDMLFTMGGISTGSARDYYNEVSYGKMTLDGVVNGWYTTNNKKSNYSSDSGNSAKCAREAAEKADAAGFNWAPYDNDGDGYVDTLWAIHSGLGAEESANTAGDIWSHSWDFDSAGIGVYTTATDWPGHPGQKIKINKYIIMPERSKCAGGNRITESIVGIGVVCHEFGHALGLPDLYDVDGTGAGLGYASLMGSGNWGGDGNDTRYPAHLDAWSKIDLGWLTPDVISSNGNKTLNSVESNNSCYLLKPSGSTTNQYFLIENRQQTGFDSTLFATGIFIYHIDEDIISNFRSNNKINNNGHAYGVALEEADATTDSYTTMHLFSSNGGRGSTGDSWPNGNKNVFSKSSIPSSKTNAGIEQYCGITNISAKSNAMTAFFYNQPASTPLSSVVLTASPATTILYSKPVTLTAVATGGLNISYKFMYGTITLRDFASSNSFSWTPLAIKTYNEITVIAKDMDGVTVTSLPISITTKIMLSTLSAVALTASPGNTILLGKPVTFTAAATGGLLVSYKFMYGTLVLRDFSLSNSYSWTPLAAKTYSNITVIAKDIDATTVTSLPVNITTKTALSAVSLTASPGNTILITKPVTLTAVATGGVNNLYKFMYGALVLRDFASSNSIAWIPAYVKIYSGITVIVKDAGGVNPLATVTSPAITITTRNALTAIALTTSPLKTAPFGTPVTLTAVATGGVNVQYKFMYGAVILRDFASSNSFVWTPLAIKTYSDITVIAKDTGGVDPNITFTSTPATNFVITTPPPPTIFLFTPSIATVGTTVTIAGTNLFGASSVKFNGKSATVIKNITSYLLITVVPVGATTGKITVTTPGGTVTSIANFTVSIGGSLGDEKTNPIDSATMVWVPGGTFTMGTEYGYTWWSPLTQQVTLSGYWIYKYEVTVAQYRAFCAATGHGLPYWWGYYSFAGKSGWDDPTIQQHPVSCVTWSDCKAYADWAGVTLPTEAQWEYAARGPQGNNYPWGGIANSSDNYNGWDQSKCANYNNSYSQNISTWPVGSFPTGVSWCGAQDMAGNLWEWCNDWYGSYSSTSVTNPTGPESGYNHVLRGGSWYDYGYNYVSGRGACRYDGYNPASVNDYYVGFRCSSPGL